MTSTWFNVTVVLLWLAAMSWLITQKVVPAFLVGEPPSYRTVVEAQQKDPLVGWAMSWDKREIGWAIQRTCPLPDDMTEVRSLVHFDDLPLDKMISEELKSLVAGGPGKLPSGFQMELKSSLTFDPLERLSQFVTSVRFGMAQDVITVRGTLDGADLALTVNSGGALREETIALPGGALLTDSLSPQTQLPGLREGQTWSIGVYSPFRPRLDPVKNVQATVEGTSPIFWDGQMVDAWLVVYRDDPGEGTAHGRNPRGRLWVRKDGRVLKQQASLFDSTMTFDRLPDADAADLADTVGDWWD